MTRGKEIIVDARLAFFEKMSTSISHDIKNCLAIINENAGLLEDLALGVEQGISLNPERLKDLSIKLKKQVHRANDIVVKMNRFACSIECPAQTVDLVESLNLMCALSATSAAMQDKELKPDLPSQTVEIITFPAVLNQTIGMCIEDAIQAAGESRTLSPALHICRDGVKIIFKPLKNLRVTSSRLLHRQKVGQDLLSTLGASVTTGISGDEMILSIP